MPLPDNIETRECSLAAGHMPEIALSVLIRHQRSTLNSLHDHQ